MTRARRGFTLLGAICMLSAGLVVMGILGKLLLAGVYLQRIAGERAARDAVVAALVEQIRTDTLGATARQWDESTGQQTLTLATHGPEGRRVVVYEIKSDHVRRIIDGRDAGAFSAARLGFSAAVGQHQNADVLLLEIRVAPPSRSKEREPRVLIESVVLPRSKAQETTAGEDQT